jgi:hypothetical protein
MVSYNVQTLDDRYLDAEVDDMSMRDVMRYRYQEAGMAEIGAKVACPACGKPFIKTTYNKRFCSNQRATGRGVNSCKDRYHNTVNPRGLGAAA